MRVLIRADASASIGSGHVMRCLTLANTLEEAGAHIEFICRENNGDLIEHIEDERGFPVHGLPKQCSTKLDAGLTAELARTGEQPDWIVVDHYALDDAWEREVRPFCKRIMVIDDLADRPHDCDLLLDQNLHDNGKRYGELVPGACTMLLGPKFALLRPEFAVARASLRERTAPVERILVSFGGTDPTGETIAFLTQLGGRQPENQFQVDCVVGTAQTSFDNVVEMTSSIPNVTLHVQTPKMAQLMAEADVGIGAGGSTIWERCCLGLPTITVAVAQHQEHYCRHLSELGYISYAGSALREPIDYVAALQDFLQNPDGRFEMSVRGMDLVDGNGASRVVENMLR